MWYLARMTFTPQVLQHFEQPHNSGELPGATVMAEASNPACGDVLHLYARVEKGVLEEVRFKASGCTTAIACGSILTDILTGVPIAHAKNLTAPMIADSLGGLPPTTEHGSQLAIDALAALLNKIK